MSRPRVAFVLPSLNGGGAERAAVTVINALDPDRFDLEMCLFRREGAYVNEVAPHVLVRSIDTTSRVRRLVELRRLFQTARPALVMSFLSYVSVLAAARWADGGIKFVINQQTPVSAFMQDRDYHWRSPLRRAAFALGVRAGYPRADLVVATSKGVRDDLVTTFGLAAEKVALVHNPVNLQSIADRVQEPIAQDLAGPGDRIVVTAGRLADVKNFPLLIKAVHLLSQRMPIRLWILGQGSDEMMLRRLAGELGIGDRVHFLGFQTNPWRYIARAHAFALTSRYEGFGNVLIEAMACGVPVVATASSGTREIIEPGVNGLLVDQHEPGAVAAALISVLEYPDEAGALVCRARTSLGHYDVPNVADRYGSLFLQLLSSA